MGTFTPSAVGLERGKFVYEKLMCPYNGCSNPFTTHTHLETWVPDEKGEKHRLIQCGGCRKILLHPYPDV
ncbi:MAG: hypothetical protein UY97_C0003G0071 [Parcubacteria group bacterium GW2011_GWB1_57_6]|nr:MAG: hypothetical protein UY93_C0002G0150 [Parcubacteria group bacterium GW2011_GWA1_56_13]KKW46797.1 MAG: hypothetical protein UY97_C0003G0071 [Parcubacteria group bacterium GW2011_GWB1_57_6]